MLGGQQTSVWKGSGGPGSWEKGNELELYWPGQMGGGRDARITEAKGGGRFLLLLSFLKLFKR
jgi:hypothetical protein